MGFYFQNHKVNTWFFSCISPLLNKTPEMVSQLQGSHISASSFLDDTASWPESRGTFPRDWHHPGEEAPVPKERPELIRLGSCGCSSHVGPARGSVGPTKGGRKWVGHPFSRVYTCSQIRCQKGLYCCRWENATLGPPHTHTLKKRKV